MCGALAAFLMRIRIFRDVTPHILIEISPLFREACCLHLQGKSKARVEKSSIDIETGRIRGCKKGSEKKSKCGS
jgi:hypothetical protein